VEASGVSIIGSQDGNVLIVSADEDNLKTLRDLVAQIDQPDGGKDRRIEVFVLKNGVAADTAAAMRSMFSRGAKSDDPIVITPQPSTNSLIVSAPATSFDEVVGLLKQLDAAPKGEEANIETIALTSAKASEVAAALKSALPPNVKVMVTAVTRSNSLLLTGSKEAIALVMDQVKRLDTEPVRSGLTFRRFKIANADATDVSYTVEQMLRARPQGRQRCDGEHRLLAAGQHGDGVRPGGPDRGDRQDHPRAGHAHRRGPLDRVREAGVREGRADGDGAEELLWPHGARGFDARGAQRHDYLGPGIELAGDPC